MYENDYLLRQIKAFVDGAVGAEDMQVEQQLDLGSTLEALAGISVHTLDSLPAPALYGMLTANEMMAAERVEAVATFLEAMSMHEPENKEARFDKAQALRRIQATRCA